MDLKVWQWRNPWDKRTYLFCYFFCLCLLLRQHETAGESGYNQEQKNEVPESSKLDSLSNFLPYDSREDSEYKRASAFFPLRGKKPSNDESIGGHPLLDQDDMEDKRSQFFPLRGKKIPDELKRASYFMPMRGRKNDGWTAEDYDITDENPSKRASSFMPMRGKKRYAEVPDFIRKNGMYSNDITEVLNPSSSNIYQITEKRMHSFVPVRGKRSYKESELPDSNILINGSYDDKISNHSTSKRSVSFNPMRGRRELEDSDTTASRGIVTSLLEKKKYSFMPMRGRRKDNSYDDFSILNKKAAAFMPMRGRRYGDGGSLEKFDTDRLPMLSESTIPSKERRTHLRDIVYDSSNIPVMESKLIDDKKSSFMPMRGRRTTLSNSNDMEDTINDDHSNFNLDKKASSFTLMRGRKSDDTKNEGSPQDSLNRKKRSAFMPMRGRRLVDEDDDFEVEPWPADQLYSLLDKKSSAFMPMRGRRLVDEDFTVEPWPAEQLISLLDKKSAFMPMRGRRTDVDNGSEEMNESESQDNYDKRSSSFLPMRGRRLYSSDSNFHYPYPYLMAGIGSSLMSKPYSEQGMSYSSVRSAARRKKLKINWDAVKRAFHATRGKRFNDNDEYLSSVKDSYTLGSQLSPDDIKSSSKNESEKMRTKRSIARPRVSLQPNRQYIALKRPMSFFATRGKRMDDFAIDSVSQLR